MEDTTAQRIEQDKADIRLGTDRAAEVHDPITITEYALEFWTNSERHGFHKPTEPEDMPRIEAVKRLMLIVSECAEAMEELRAPEFNADAWAEELADIYIRLGDLAIDTNVDLGAAVAKKHAKNIDRPVMHGNKRF